MSQVEDTRALRGRQKAERKKYKEARAVKAQQQEVQILASLTKPLLKPHQLVNKILPSGVPAPDQRPFLDFLSRVIKKSPRLLGSVVTRTDGRAQNEHWGTPLYALYIAAVLVGADLDLQDWEPKVKGTRSVFQHLVRHLLEKYHQPNFLWTALEESDFMVATTLAPVVAHVAQGGSLFKVIPGLFPVVLSRKQCHELLQSSSDIGFLEAIRYQQAKAYGGSRRLAVAWVASRIGSELGPSSHEAFWETVMAFFAKNPMLDLHHLGSIIDYISYRRGMDVSFSMKGRTAMALLRDVEEWHQTLHRAKVAGGKPFMPSGFSSYQTERSRREPSGNFVREVWNVKEILSGKDLHEEGRKMHHCVYSYTYSIESKKVSIWSMTVETELSLERVLTIEVYNRERRVVQAKGEWNRDGNIQEFRVLSAWAKQNSISMGRYL
jgi:hypothetical protein